MLKHNAASFTRLSAYVGRTIQAFDPNQRPDAALIGNTLRQIDKEAEDLGLSSVSAQIKRINAMVQKCSDDKTSLELSKLKVMLEELLNRMEDSLEERVFLSLSATTAALFEQSEPLFGSLVETVFPDLSEDISEAGKCMAVDRNTASVFHLMRVMERCIKIIGVRVTGIDSETKKWGSIEKDIRTYVESLLPLSPEKAVFSEMLLHFGLVRAAWRNEVMHPKQTYTREEAQRVYDATKGFVQDLAALFSPSA